MEQRGLASKAPASVAKAVDIAQLFKNGRSQAVRLPAAYRFEGTAVRVSRRGRAVILEPITIDLLEWFAEIDRPRYECVHRPYQWLTAYRSSALHGHTRNASANRHFDDRDLRALYGVAKNSRITKNTARLEAFLAGPLETIAFDDDDSSVGGEIRAQLERAGRPIGAYDTLIAAQAVRRNAILATANVNEFERVVGLRVEDWTR